MSKEKPTYNFNFYGNVGQNIAHVDKLEAHFDKDATMHIANVDTTSIVQHKPDVTRKPRVKASKITQATFEYKHNKQHSNRIVKLYQTLSKGQIIAEDTNPDDFCAIFEGKTSNVKIRWLQSQSILYSLIRQIVERGLVTIPQGATIWQITESHFLDKNSRPFHSFNKQKEPKKAQLSITKLVDILDPAVINQA